MKDPYYKPVQASSKTVIGSKQAKMEAMVEDLLGLGDSVKPADSDKFWNMEDASLTLVVSENSDPNLDEEPR